MKDYSDAVLAGLIPVPVPDANKYSRGRLTLLAGSASYPGAACLAAMAAQRSGAGYVEVFTDDAALTPIRMGHPSLVARSWDSWDAGAAILPSSPDRPRAYVVGCGFEPSDGFAARLTRRLLKDADAPVLVDGGALGFLSKKKMRALCRARRKRGGITVLTPHAGEAASLARAFALEVADPRRLALELSGAYGAITVLKGPETFISDGADVWAMTVGTSALAKAGTGDVLAGIIGAFLAQGMDAVDACVLGTTLHACAGTEAARELTDISVCAEDVVDNLPAAIKRLQACV